MKIMNDIADIYALSTDQGVISAILDDLLNTFIIPIVIPFVLKMIGIVIIFFIGTKIIKLSRKIVKKILEKGDAEKGVITFLDNLVKLGLYAVLVIIILCCFGVEMTSIAAVVASAGVAVGLALQGSLSNLAGGVLILVLRPFRVDDYIVANGLEGTVTEIQLFYTKLKTGDNRVIVMPNGSLSNGNIINVSAMDKRRLDVIANIAYTADLKLAKNVLMNLLEECPYVLKDEDYDVFVSNLGASSVDLTVRLWAKKEEYWAAKCYITENIKLTLDANNIEIPYNKLDVQVQQLDK